MTGLLGVLRGPEGEAHPAVTGTGEVMLLGLVLLIWAVSRRQGPGGMRALLAWAAGSWEYRVWGRKWVDLVWGMRSRHSWLSRWTNG